MCRAKVRHHHVGGRRRLTIDSKLLFGLFELRVDVLHPVREAGDQITHQLASVPGLYPEIFRAQTVGGSQISY